MDASLHGFVSEYLGVVAATLIAVIVVAFLSIPFSLGGFPGEIGKADTHSGARHMT
jgi:hypothetical protein